jgi:hypothetical protein
MMHLNRVAITVVAWNGLSPCPLRSGTNDCKRNVPWSRPSLAAWTLGGGFRAIYFLALAAMSALVK